jgi:PTH1 family peptidyl-tRNA hydrolase
MILIAGLGNPGKKYTKTRHNVGFRIIDSMKKSPTPAKNKKVILLKPDTFMNESGKAIQKTIAYYKIPPDNLIIIHDEIDLPFGEIRVSKNSSSAGHKGVQSIIDGLKTKDFTRIRIGIYPRSKVKSQKSKVDTTDFVLEKFSKKEEKEFEDITKRAIEEINALLSSRS